MEARTDHGHVDAVVEVQDAVWESFNCGATPAVNFSADGEFCAFGGCGMVHVWEMRAVECHIATLVIQSTAVNRHNYLCSCVVWSADNSSIVAFFLHRGSSEGLVVVWDTASCRQTHAMR
jgi:hypothetical protein